MVPHGAHYGHDDKQNEEVVFQLVAVCISCTVLCCQAVCVEVPSMEEGQRCSHSVHSAALRDRAAL